MTVRLPWKEPMEEAVLTALAGFSRKFFIPGQTSLKKRKGEGTMKIRSIIVFVLILQFAAATSLFAQMEKEPKSMAKQEALQSLITSTPEEGFQLAVKLARKGVTTTQPDKEILHMQREVYSRDADSLIAASHVIATYFNTIAAANNYWQDKK
jgi:hypothetical protein